MSTVKWHEGRLAALDTETTGTDPHTARIVTAAVVYLEPGKRPAKVEWLIDPGVDVPDEAAAVHGFTRDRILHLVGGEGRALRTSSATTSRQVMTVDGALNEIAMHTASAIGREVPLVVHNAAYDLTLLEAELARNSIDSLASRPSGIRGVIDPMVLERAFDQYRKTCYKQDGEGNWCDRVNGIHGCSGCRRGRWQCGGCGTHDRTLGSLCRHYGIVHTGAHGAAADALAATRLAVKLAGLWPEIARWRLGTLHAHQVTWRRQQQDGLRDFFKRVGNDAWLEVSSDWPLQRLAVA